MSTSIPFSKDDLQLIKWEVGIAVLSILIATSVYIGINHNYQESVTKLNTARAENIQALSLVESIEEEENTIIQYIDQYQALAAEGIIENEDRLQMHEVISEIRAEHSLFPIALTIDEQTSFQLQYDSSEREPGQPIDLKSSFIELSLPLLHEEDLTRLLNSIVNSPGLFQLQECKLDLSSPINSSFYVLSQHQSAECTMLWYTFDLAPTPTTSAQDSGFL